MAMGAGAARRSVELKEVFHPDIVYETVEFPWYAVGEVRWVPETNPGVGYIYEDGPSPTVDIVRNDGSRVQVPRDPTRIYAVYKRGTYPPGATVDSRDLVRGAVFPEDGEYRVKIASGVVDEGRGVFYADEVVTYVVAAERLPPQPTAPTPPPPIPLREILAISTAAALLGAVVGFALAGRGS